MDNLTVEMVSFLKGALAMTIVLVIVWCVGILCGMWKGRKMDQPFIPPWALSYIGFACNRGVDPVPHLRAMFPEYRWVAYTSELYKPCLPEEHIMEFADGSMIVATPTLRPPTSGVAERWSMKVTA